MTDKYAALSDEELVGLYKGGDVDVFEEIFNRSKRLIKSLARNFFLVGGDDEDLRQEGLLGLLAAVNKYDQVKGGAFKTFAYLCIRSRMLNAVAGASSKKHGPLNNSLPLTEFGEEKDLFHGFSPEDTLIGSESVSELKKKIKAALSAFEIQVFDLDLEGYTYLEIAEMLNKTPKSVDNALQRIKEKIRLLRR